MNMVRLIYVSRMTEACDTNALKAIMEISRVKNRKLGVSGVLYYDPSFFMQCLEGPRPAVNDLYDTIVRDPRHSNVTLLEYQDIEERLFSGWSMGFMTANELDKQTLARFTSQGRFTPFMWTAIEARDFLLKNMRNRRQRYFEEVMVSELPAMTLAK